LSEGDVCWVTGGEGRIVTAGADSIVLRSSVPSPPGSRIEGVVAAADGFPLRVKVHACRLQPEGDFLIEGRPLDLTRGHRERLEAIATLRTDRSGRSG
jgi:hypothetical protein